MLIWPYLRDPLRPRVGEWPISLRSECTQARLLRSCDWLEGPHGIFSRTNTSPLHIHTLASAPIITHTFSLPLARARPHLLCLRSHSLWLPAIPSLAPSSNSLLTCSRISIGCYHLCPRMSLSLLLWCCHAAGGGPGFALCAAQGRRPPGSARRPSGHSLTVLTPGYSSR